MLESNVVGYIPVTSEIEALAKIDFIVSTELFSEEAAVYTFNMATVYKSFLGNIKNGNVQSSWL